MSYAIPKLEERRNFLLRSVAIGGAALLGVHAHAAGDEEFVALAIEQARLGVENGQWPFGACIVKDGKVVVAVYNVGAAETDVTAHAEVHAIRRACRELNTLDLSGCTLYASCEPCPMCFSAAFWARVPSVVYGCRIADVEQLGIRQIPIPAHTMNRLSGGGMQIKGDVLRAQSIAVITDWLRKGQKI